MLRGALAGHLAAELGALRKDGRNHGLLLVGNEFYGAPIPRPLEVLNWTRGFRGRDGW